MVGSNKKKMESFRPSRLSDAYALLGSSPCTTLSCRGPDADAILDFSPSNFPQGLGLRIDWLSVAYTGNMSWSRPGDTEWDKFTGFLQLFGNIVLACRKDLDGWSEGTFREMMRWATFIEEVVDEMEPFDEQQTQQYLSCPTQFAQTGYDNRDVNVVIQAGLNVKVLSAASHYLLRQVVGNSNLPRNVTIFRTVMRAYAQLGEPDDPETVAEALTVWVKDASKEIFPSLPSVFASEWMLQYSGRLVFEQLSFSPTSVYDCEMRFFLRHPSAVRQLGQSRALVPHLTTLAFVEKCVRQCRPFPELLPVLLLSMIPRPLFLQSPGLQTHCSPLIREMLVAELLRHQHVLGLWSPNAVDSFLLIQIAAQSPEFANAWP